MTIVQVPAPIEEYGMLLGDCEPTLYTICIEAYQLETCSPPSVWLLMLEQEYSSPSGDTSMGSIVADAHPAGIRSKHIKTPGNTNR